MKNEKNVKFAEITFVLLLFRYADARFVFNMDETKLAVKNKKLKKFVPKDMKSPMQKPPAIPPCHITLILCITADGSAIKPTAILPNFDNKILDMFNWGGSSSGWITEQLFLSWVKNVFVPDVIARRQ